MIISQIVILPFAHNLQSFKQTSEITIQKSIYYYYYLKKIRNQSTIYFEDDIIFSVLCWLRFQSKRGILTLMILLSLVSEQESESLMLKIFFYLSFNFIFYYLMYLYFRFALKLTFKHAWCEHYYTKLNNNASYYFINMAIWNDLMQNKYLKLKYKQIFFHIILIWIMMVLLFFESYAFNFPYSLFHWFQ